MTHILDFVRQTPEYALGISDADRDFVDGKLAQRDFGPSPPWWNNAVDDLRLEYNISFEVVDVTTDHALISRCIGYNERMREYITIKFGRDVIGIAHRMAEAKL